MIDYLRPMESTYPILYIKKDRVASVKRKHPWIFSRGVLPHDAPSDGTIVEIHHKRQGYLATGYYQDGSILVRILSFSGEEINQDYWDNKISQAYKLRNQIGLPSTETNAYRLFHGEGDGVPGLIIDVYNDVAVIQCHTIGVHMVIDQVANALTKTLGPALDSIYDKSKNALPQTYSAKLKDGCIKGNKTKVRINENKHLFEIDLINSQKTGFFLDQRDNRQLVSNYAKGKRLLNLYCYTGGFSIYALNHGASAVCSIDASRTAMSTLEDNLELNGGYKHHISLTEDVNKYINTIEAHEYDIIVVDPPAFAKSIRKRHNAVQAYKRVNAAAISKVAPGGMIFTFSCSQVIDAKLFYDTITAAAIETGRQCRVIHHMSQGADHPVSIYHPEGKYLKGLVLAVE